MKVDFKLCNPVIEGIFGEIDKNTYFLEANLWREEELPERIKNIMKDKFPSIIFMDTPSTIMYNMFFKFENEEDEAFFLVWSSEGVGVEI